MTTKELMIGDIIGVTHEELGLVYAKVEYINETGDLMVRADNDYMNGGYECTVKDCESIKLTNELLERNGFQINDGVENSNFIAFYVEGKRYLYQVFYLHQLQQVCRLCGIEIDWKL